jgi:signal transduction histidine kinase
VTAAVRVVLADDTEDIRMLTRTVLDLDGGFEVVGEASTGVEALDLVRELVPDVVVLDLAMPEMDGLQALPAIRELSPATQVVVLSGFERQALGAEAFALGAAEYVYKGQPLTELVAVLRDVAGRPAVPIAEPVEAGSDADFLAMVVHDLRSPLAAIRGVADVLAADERIAGDPRTRELIEVQRRQATLMARLVDDLLTVTRVEGGQLHLARRQVALAPLLASLASVQADGVQLSCEPDVEVHVDPERLAQMVNNLVANARNHGAPPVSVAVARHGDEVVVAVVDAGPGVPDGRQHELFERFSPLARGGSGNGLGLYIVRELARAHGGDATYRPASPGSCFEVRLPAQG